MHADSLFLSESDYSVSVALVYLSPTIYASMYTIPTTSVQLIFQALRFITERLYNNRPESRQPPRKKKPADIRFHARI